VTVVSDPPAGTMLPIGTTSVTVMVVNINGVTASCTFDVIVEAPDAPPPAGQDVPAAQSVDRNLLRVLLTLFFGAPVCGVGLMSMLPVTLVGVSGMKVCARRRGAKR
jgi:hypothetical protein